MHKRRTNLKNIPAAPLDVAKAFFKLIKRETEIKQAKRGLATFYTIQNTKTTGFNFLFGKKDETPPVSRVLTDGITPFEKKDPGGKLTKLSLEEPEQFSMSWTVLPDVYDSSKNLLPKFAATLKDAAAATEQFWPTISEYGLPYNLLIAQKLGSSEMPDRRAEFADAWKSAWDDLEERGLLYVIDMMIFDGFKPCEKYDQTRFTPATVTLLEQNPDTKNLTPLAVRVAGYEGANKQVYVRGTVTPSAWLYALQAAKVSITVYGIWLGHVYHWHIVTAAMQFTMYRTFKKTTRFANC